jgi:hypothetical protein
MLVNTNFTRATVLASLRGALEFVGLLAWQIQA